MLPAILAALGEGGGLASLAGMAGRTGGGLQSLTTMGGGPPPLPGSGGLRSMFEAGRAMETFGGHVDELNRGFGHLNPHVAKFVGAVTYLPNQLLQAKTAIVATGQAWVDALAAPNDTVHALGQSVARLVRYWNPAAVTRFEIAVENSFATLGRTVEPILNSLTRAAQRVANVEAKIRPALEPLVSATAETVDALSHDLVPVMREMAPLIHLQAQTWGGLLRVVSAIGFPIIRITEALQRLTGGKAVSPLGAILGGGWDPKGQGDLAVRQASFVNTEDIARNAHKAAMMASGGAKTTDQAIIETPDKLQQILDFLGQNLTSDIILRAAVALGGALLDKIPKLPGGEMPRGLLDLFRGLMNPGR